ncbi:MAG TPA: preprotein translocase subunit SecE [Dehalococcoidia bacterium]|nr:preprotein translocase subunit SecE [Dehalococcoidia bacterium]
MARPSSNRRSRRRRPKGQVSAANAAGAVAASDTVDASSATVPPPQTLLRPRRETPRPAEPSAGAGPSRRLRIPRPPFIADIFSELQKVVWPTRAETANLTLVVVVVAIAVGILLGVVDWGFSRILKNVLLP